MDSIKKEITSTSHTHIKGKSRDKKKNVNQNKLPATVLCGFLGSGKTTLLNNILNNKKGIRVAVIVNDMSEINIDAANIQNGQATFKRTQEKLVELSNGCICCTLRDDLIKEISKMARTKRFDYLLIESTGMAEPLPIAHAFSEIPDETGKTLFELAYIDTMVTVVDALNFFDQINSIEKIKEEVRVGKETRMEEIPVSQLFIDQVEFANVIIVNKIDLISKEKLNLVESLVRRLNPTAEIIISEYTNIDLSKILDTKKFDLEEAENSDKWNKELEKPFHKSEIEEYGFSSFFFKSRKPFNPEKLSDFLKSDALKGVVRAKGYVWLATNWYACGMLDIVGQVRQIKGHSIWWAAIRKNKWGNTKEEIELVENFVKPNWEGEFGDRRNELVFIGQSMQKELVLKELADCLITDAEYDLSSSKWEQMFKDPFQDLHQLVKAHPFREDFKERDGDWEDDENLEEEEGDEQEVKKEGK